MGDRGGEEGQGWGGVGEGALGGGGVVPQKTSESGNVRLGQFANLFGLGVGGWGWQVLVCAKLAELDPNWCQGLHHNWALFQRGGGGGSPSFAQPAT